MFIVSIALFLAGILLFAGFLTSSLLLLATAQQTTPTTVQGTTTTPLLPPPPPSSSSGTTTGQTTSSITTIPPLTPQEQEQLTRLQNVIAATNLNLDETEKQIGGIVYTPRWSDPVWVEPDSASVLVAYCLPGEFAESGQEILGGGFELEVLESYEVALPQNFTAWMMVIGNEDRQNRYPAAVGVICASDANDAETRVVSPEEQQQINNVISQFTQVTSIDQVINIINRNNNNNNATNQNATGGAGGAPPPASRDTNPPALFVPNNLVLQTNGAPTALLEYSVTAQDDRDGTATLDEDNQLIQGDNVGGNIFISCRPSSQYFLSPGNRTVDCLAADAVNNTAEASFIVTVRGPTTNTPPGGGTSGSGITASVSANPATYNGPCPVTIEFSGTITDNVGNRDVTYRTIYSDGAATSPQTIHFDQPGSQTISNPAAGPGRPYTWTIGDINLLPSYQGWMAIEILQPVQLQSNRAEFQMTCTPTMGAAPQTLQAENDTTTATDEDDEEDAAATGQGGAGGTGGTDGEPAGTTTDAPSNGGGGTDGAGTDGEPAGTTTEGTGAGEGTDGGTDAESPSE